MLLTVGQCSHMLFSALRHLRNKVNFVGFENYWHSIHVRSVFAGFSLGQQVIHFLLLPFHMMAHPLASFVHKNTVFFKDTKNCLYCENYG